jgi:CheY-like chemotaxis protein
VSDRSGGPPPVSLLLVDDNAAVPTSLERRLSSRGHRIAASTTRGEKAAELAEKLRPEVVVTDLDMPGFNGVSNDSRHPRIRTWHPSDCLQWECRPERG